MFSSVKWEIDWILIGINGRFNSMDKYVVHGKSTDYSIESDRAIVSFLYCNDVFELKSRLLYML